MGKLYNPRSEKVLRNTHTKSRKLKIEAVTNMNDCFTICQCKIEEPKNSEISAPFSLKV